MLSARSNCLLMWACLYACSLWPCVASAQPSAADEDAAAPVETDSGRSDSAAQDTSNSLPAELTPQETAEYFELLKLFADTLDQVERNYVEQVSRRELLEAAIQGVLAKLDEYSDYIPPDQFDSFRTGVENEFGGIGIKVGIMDGQLTVITPLYDTPAYRTGVLAGDRILMIGDQSTEGLKLEDAIGLMKGPIGSDIKLRVKHPDDVEEQVTLKRELVRMETVLGVFRRADDRWEYMLDDEQQVGYIRISSFSGHTAEDLKRALRDLTEREVKMLVLDLRFNPGGLLSSAVEVADCFLSDGLIVSTEGRNTPRREWKATEPGTFDRVEVVVLINQYSASASEIVAACLQDHQRAVIIGERSWGKGSVQNIIELEGGRSALKLTTAGYKRPSGKNIHRFEGATEDDDWGVQANAGHELRLSLDETRRLLAFHRDLDVIRTPSQKKEPRPETYIDPQLKAALDYAVKQ